MLRLKVSGLTSIHNGDKGKPNEDAFFSFENCVALADGISRTRMPSGEYPANSTLVADFFVRKMVNFLHRKPADINLVLQAVKVANQGIAKINKKMGITSKTVDFMLNDYFGTTGLVLSVSNGKAIFAYIGDPIGIYLPKNREPKLLTRDQLHPCHGFSYTHFAGKKEERLLFQRKIARNNLTATNPNNGELIGFGALTGEASALDFLEISEFDVQAGDKFLLSSDALRVTATISDNEEETVDSYSEALQIVAKTEFSKLPEILIRFIREQEVAKDARSDDATIVIVEISEL